TWAPAAVHDRLWLHPKSEPLRQALRRGVTSGKGLWSTRWPPSLRPYAPIHPPGKIKPPTFTSLLSDRFSSILDAGSWCSRLRAYPIISGKRPVTSDEPSHPDPVGHRARRSVRRRAAL